MHLKAKDGEYSARQRNKDAGAHMLAQVRPGRVAGRTDLSSLATPVSSTDAIVSSARSASRERVLELTAITFDIVH